MNTNRMASFSLDQIQEAALKAFDLLQSDPELFTVGMVVMLKMLEEQGVCEITDLYAVAESMIADLNQTECEQYRALQMYIENEL